jgi:hypothetical protein
MFAMPLRYLTRIISHRWMGYAVHISAMIVPATGHIVAIESGLLDTIDAGNSQPEC